MAEYKVEYVNVKIDADVLVDMLIDRLRAWTQDTDILDLYREYYENLVYGGSFEGSEFDPMLIVDNDWVNYLDVITEDEFDNYNIESVEDGQDSGKIVWERDGLYLIDCTV